MVTLDSERESQRTLQRLLPRLEKDLTDSISADPQGWQDFVERIDKDV